MRNLQVGSIRGNNNQVQQNNYHIRNVTNNNGGDGNGSRQDEGGSDNSGVGFLVAIGGATILAAALYLKYYEIIFLWLKLVLMVTASLHVYSLIVHWQVGEDGQAKGWHPLAGLALCLAQALAILLANGTLPTEVLDIIAQPTRASGGIPWALEIWHRFSSEGHKLILDSMLSVVALCISLLVGLAFSIQHAIDVLAMALESRFAGYMANLLRGFKTWGVWLAAFLTVVSYVFAAGLLR